MVRVLALLPLITLAEPATACAPPPPSMEVVANDKATIAPDGGIIVRLDDDFGGTGGRLVAQADGAAMPQDRNNIAYGLSVLKAKPGAKKLDLLRSGKLINSFTVAASTPLAAPSLISVRSTAKRPGGEPNQMFPPVTTMTIEIGAAHPADAYTLVIYKLDADGARSVAYGMPDTNRKFMFSTGGKECRGGFETLYPGEKIAVAWLDIHGQLSKRSSTVTVR